VALSEVLKAREAEKGDCRAGRGAASFRSKADPQLDIPEKVGIGLARGSEKVAKRILELLADGPMRPSALREAVGIRSRVHFSRCYMTPLVEKERQKGQVCIASRGEVKKLYLEVSPERNRE